MEELAAQFIQCFNVLQSTDGNAIFQASQLVKELSLNENAIPTLILILQTNQEPYIRFQSAITLKYSFRGINNESFNPENLITTLLTIVSNEPEKIIRGYLVHIVGKTLVNKPTLHLAISFAQAALQSSNQQQIHAAIQLLDNLIGIFETVDEQLIQFVNQLTLAAINFNDLELTLDTFNFYFNFINEHYDQVDENSSKLWSIAISLFPQISNPQQFWELSKIVGDCVDSKATYVDVTPLLPLCYQIFIQENVDISIKDSLIYILDSIIVSNPEQVLEANLVIPLFQNYAQLALKEYKPDESIEMCESDIMKNICQTFSSDENFVVTVWGMIKGFQPSDQSQYISMIILQYLFNPDIDFFDEILDDIATLINVSLASQSTSTKEAGIQCLYEFIEIFTEIDDFIAIFEQTIIQIIQVKPDISLIAALTAVMKESESTDGIFELVFPILFYLIPISSAEDNLTIIHSLSILSLHSYVGVLNHYEEIITIMQNLLGNPSEGIEILKSDAIECLINLMRVSPDHFRPGLSAFLPVIISFLNTSYPSLVCACINCIGTMVDLYSDDIEPVIPQLLDGMAQFASADKSDYFNQLQQLCKQDYDNEEIDELLGAPTLDKDSIDMPGGAFIVFALILEKYPELLPANFERAVNLIRILSDSHFENSNHAVCIGVEYIMRATAAINFNSPLMEVILINLKTLIEKTDTIGIVGEAIQSIAALIHASGLNSLGGHITSLPEDIINILRCNLKCIEVSETILPEELYQPLIALFFTLFDILSPEDSATFMKDIIPVILELSGKSKKEKAFSLDILVNYAKHGYNPSPEFLPNIFNLTVECIKNNLSSGFVAIETLASFAPDLLRANAEILLQLYAQKLTAKKKKSQRNYQSMIDCCVSSLGALAMQVLGDDFPLQQFGQIVLSKLPPSQDLDETLESYNFLIWMIPRGIEYLKNDIIAALARLFASPPMTIKEMNLDQESYDTFKGTFLKLLQVTKDGDQICHAALGNDPISIQLLQNALNS